MKFTENQEVTWSSQAAVRSKTKTGVIAQVVAPGKRPDRSRFPTLYTSSGCGFGRKVESYVVMVGNKPYWPRESLLRPIRDPLDARVCPGCVVELPDDAEGSCPHCDYEFDAERFPTIREIMQLGGGLNNVSPAFIKEVAARAAS
jgi:hypothetical protein